MTALHKYFCSIEIIIFFTLTFLYEFPMIHKRKCRGDSMYNEEQKRRFLEAIESDSSRNYAEIMFNRFAAFEEKYGKDIASWDSELVYKVMGKLYTFDFGLIKQYLSTLNMYRDSADDRLDVSKIDLSQSIREVFIKDTFELQAEIRKLKDPKDGYYICAAICFAWLGIPAATMPFIKESSVDCKNHTIIDADCNVCITDIDENIIKVLSEYIETKESTRMHKSLCKVYPTYNGMFLRRMDGINSKKDVGPIKRASLLKEFQRISGDKKKENQPRKTDYTSILRSGGMFRLYQLEKSGVDVFSGKNDDLLLQTYGAPGKTFDIRSLYRQYKRAFNLG